MSYFSPYIDSTGLHTPTFSDIQNNLIFQAQSIFGTDIYLDNDSQDMQFIGVLSKAIYDAFQLAQLIYNNQSPQNAVGTGLDSVVKINGLERNQATYSTCPVVLKGSSGTSISSGVVQDANGYLWSLPTSITIPSGGILTVTATCQTAGAIQAAAGDISTIATPLYGWNQVYNAVAATAGTDTETDAALQYRQSQSVALPSQTPIEGTLAAIQTVDGVNRKIIYENPWNIVDGNGLEPHTIAAVVEGGDDTEVASQIALKKTIGCGTYGSTSITLSSDSYLTEPINFSRPSYVVIDVVVNVVPLNRYTMSAQMQIQENIESYLNNLDIGQTIYASSLFSPAIEAMPSLSNPEFNVSSIQVAIHGGAYGESILLAWNQCAQAGTITVTGGY